MKIKFGWALLLPLALVSSMAMARHGSGGGHYGGFVSVHPTHIVTVPRHIYRPYYGVGVGVGLGVGLGLGFGSYWYSGYPYYPYYPSDPVIIERNTVVERTSDDAVVPYDNAVPSRSLLRDLQGRCYERTYDRGRETRVELDPSECNF